MFKNDFQGGAYFEIFSAQMKDALLNWKLVGNASIRKVYEKEVKGFVYSLEGTTTTTKMTLPKDSRQSLVLIQHYLIFQSFINRGQDFSIELGIVDISCNKRRILLSTAQREVQSTPLHAKVPLNFIKRGTWLNLCIDLVSLVGDLWKGQTFKAVESVSVTASCQLRKIFSMKRSPYETNDENNVNQNSMMNFDSIPKQCQFSNDVQHETQVVNLKKILRKDKHQNEENSVCKENLFLPTNQSMSHSEWDSKPKSQIAFGSKVPTLAPKRNSQKKFPSELHLPNPQKRNGSPSESCTSSNFTNQNSSVGTIQNPLEPDLSFKPHPPREPSSEKNRRRIRVKSGGHEPKTKSLNSKTTNLLTNSKDELQIQGKLQRKESEDKPKTEIVLKTKKYKTKAGPPPSPPPLSMWKEEKEKKSLSEEKIPQSQNHFIKSNFVAKKHQSQTRTTDQSCSSGFLDAGVGPDVPEIQSPREPIEMDEPLCEVIAMLKNGLVAADGELSDNGSITEEPYANEYEDDIDLNFSDEKDPVYVFTSLPKSAPDCSHSPFQENEALNLKSKSIVNDSIRGAKPEDDFVSIGNGSDEEDQCNAVETATNPVCVRTHSGTSSRGSSGKSVSSRTTILLPEKASRLPVQSQLMRQPPSVQSRPNIGNAIPYNCRQYTSQNSMSKLNRKSLREVIPPNLRKSAFVSGDKPYDSSKYQSPENGLMDPLEEQMLASLKREHDEEIASTQKKLEPGTPGVDPSIIANHLYDDSLTTNSDDDTTFNSLKVPLALRFGHNYKEEMKYPSRRSTDTLSSSNPRDWSNLFSPPIVLASELKQEPLQATLDVCSHPKFITDCNHFDEEKNPWPEKDQQKEENEKKRKEKEEELQLLYDPILNYYFDPKTGKYYQLI